MPLLLGLTKKKRLISIALRNMFARLFSKERRTSELTKTDRTPVEVEFWRGLL